MHTCTHTNMVSLELKKNSIVAASRKRKIKDNEQGGERKV